MAVYIYLFKLSFSGIIEHVYGIVCFTVVLKLDVLLLTSRNVAVEIVVIDVEIISLHVKCTGNGQQLSEDVL